MSKTSATFILIVIIGLTLPMFFITIPLIFMLYNRLIAKKNKVDFSYGGMDVMLKKRTDLIPNVVASVKKIMIHEKELLENITKLRENISREEKSSENRLQLEGQMSELLGSFSLTMENYPELKSNENVLHLQRTLNEIEEQISASRRMYNSAVVSFNDCIAMIPTNVIAAFLSYTSKPYFEATEKEKQTPEVSSLF